MPHPHGRSASETASTFSERCPTTPSTRSSPTPHTADGISFLSHEWDSPDRKRTRKEYAEEHYGGSDDPRDQYRLARASGVRYPDGTDIRNGRAFQEWCEEWGREALRVVKPGGHILSFASTRMYHRLVCGLEEAGWEVRDTIHWMYGCLSDDTEILTADGWKLGTEVGVGDLVAAWDPESECIALSPVEDTFRTPFRGDMLALRNHDTEQLVTPNHRVYHYPRRRQMLDGVRGVWYDDDHAVCEAQDLPNNFKLPLAGLHDGAGIGGEDYAALLGWVWTDGSLDVSGNGVRVYQYPSANPANCEEITLLLKRLVPEHKQYTRERNHVRDDGSPRGGTETTWFFTGEVAARVRADLPGKLPTWALLWRMTMDEKLAFLDAAIKGDGCRSRSGSGKGGGKIAFDQKSRHGIEWLQALLTLTGQRARLYTRRDGMWTATVTPRPTTELQHKHQMPQREFYDGDVWCVKVVTGAFVARRNDLVFITGNSGWPKSLNLSKVIDAQAGAEREVIGTMRTNVGMQGGQYGANAGTGEIEITRAATPEAQKWEGWGTALKPSHEPIVLARKPLAGSVVATAQQYGTGALNIDANRIPVGEEVISTPQSSPEAREGVVGKAHTYSRLTEDEFHRRQREAVDRANTLGRWPANSVFTHHHECSADAGCHADCPLDHLDGQTGVLTSGKMTPASIHSTDGGYSGGMQGTPACVRETPGDSGGASRFFTQTFWDPVWDDPFRYVAKPSRAERDAGLGERFQTQTVEVEEEGGGGGDEVLDSRNPHSTVKPVELCRWLIRLVTPPGGTTMDIFTGSGTSGVAAVIEGFNFIGIEQDPTYAEVARARITEAVRAVDDGAVATGRDWPSVARARLDYAKNADPSQIRLL